MNITLLSASYLGCTVATTSLHYNTGYIHDSKRFSSPPQIIWCVPFVEWHHDILVIAADPLKLNSLKARS